MSTTREQRFTTVERAWLDGQGLDVDERWCRVTVSGEPVSIRVLGYGEGEPVLFLHAATWFAAHWSLLASSIPSRRLLWVDMPGHGLSDAVDFSREPRRRMVEVVAGVLAALDVARAAVVGNSLGGMAGLWTALDRPSLVDRVIVVGVPATALPGARPDLMLSLMSVPVVNRIGLRLAVSPLATRWAMRAPLGREGMAALPEPLSELQHLGRRRREFSTTISTWVPATHRWRRARPEVVLTDRELAAIGAPVRFYWGRHDPYGSTAMAHEAAARLDDATVDEHDHGHFPQLTDPTVCGRAITRLLDS